MEQSVAAVESIIGYCFRDKTLLEEALTHSSSFGVAAAAATTSYERLEFLGDAAIGLAVTNHVFREYPTVDPGELSPLRAANVSTEKLARVAVRHGLYRYLRRSAPDLDAQVNTFAEGVRNEEEAVAVAHEGSAPKVLADIVESIAAAIYVDVNFDLKRLWRIFGGLLEPYMVTLEEYWLSKLCQEQGKQYDIKLSKDTTKTVVAVYVDGKFIASDLSEQKEIAKLNAVKLALCNLSKSMPSTDGLSKIMAKIDYSPEIKGAKECYFPRGKNLTKPPPLVEDDVKASPLGSIIEALCYCIKTSIKVLNIFVVTCMYVCLFLLFVGLFSHIYRSIYM